MNKVAKTTWLAVVVLVAIILFLQWRPAGIFVTRSRSLED